MSPATAQHRVVPANAADVPHIVRCWTELIAVHAPIDARLYATVPDAEERYREHVRRQINAPKGVVVVAPTDDDHGIKGYLLGGHGQRAGVYTVRDVGMIFDVAVSPAHRRQGVGEALVAAGLRRFKLRGLTDVQVTWSPGNRLADGFWRKLGFAPLLIEAYRPL